MLSSLVGENWEANTHSSRHGFLIIAHDSVLSHLGFEYAATLGCCGDDLDCGDARISLAGHRARLPLGFPNQRDQAWHTISKFFSIQQQSGVLRPNPLHATPHLISLQAGEGTNGFLKPPVPQAAAVSLMQGSLVSVN